MPLFLRPVHHQHPRSVHPANDFFERQSPPMNLLIKPTVSNPERRCRDAEIDRGSVERKAHVHAPIVGLFKGGRPCAVAGLVVAVVFFSLQAETLWALPHVRKEVGERLPALANGDAAPSVSRVRAKVRVGAPVDHVSPDSIFLSLAADRLTVEQPSQPIGEHVTFVAAARRRVTGSNANTVESHGCPAVAATLPPGFAAPGLVRHPLYDDQPIEASPFHFYQLSHGGRKA